MNTDEVKEVYEQSKIIDSKMDQLDSLESKRFKNTTHKFTISLDMSQVRRRACGSENEHVCVIRLGDNDIETKQLFDILINKLQESVHKAKNDMRNLGIEYTSERTSGT